MKIHIYPGMGATASMYAGPWLDFLPNNCCFWNWPKFNHETSIEALAQRLIDEHNIAQNDILIGSSLGGILACEIANQMNIRQLVLVGSAQDKDEINGLLAILHPLIDLAPLAFIQRLAGKLPNDLCSMFNQSDAAFIRAMCKAIFLWEGLSSAVQPYRIHGTQDRVIPCPKQTDYKIKGGHLIGITHPEECVNAIQKLISI